MSDRAPVFPPQSYPHWIEDNVRFSDLDPLGHVNNNAIGQYFENARADLYRQATPLWPLGDYVFVLARSVIDFRRELHMPAHLRIATGVMKIGRTSLTVSNALFRGDEGIAYGESVSVLIHEKTRQAVEIGTDLRQILERYGMRAG